MLNIANLLKRIEQNEIDTVDLAGKKVIDSKVEKLTDNYLHFSNKNIAIVNEPHSQNVIVLGDYYDDDRGLLSYFVDSVTGHIIKSIKIKDFPNMNNAVLGGSGRIVFNAGRTLKQWDYINGTIKAYNNASQSIKHYHQKALIPLPANKLASLPENVNEIDIWDIQAEKWLKNLSYGTVSAKDMGTTGVKGIRSIALLKDGRLASAGADNTIRIWNIDNGRCEQFMHSDAWFLQVLPDGKLISLSYQGVARIFNPNTGECLLTWEIRAKDINKQSFSGVRNMTLLSNGLLALSLYSEEYFHLFFFEPLTGECTANAVCGAKAPLTIYEFKPNILLILQYNYQGSSSYYKFLRVELISRPVNQEELRKILSKLSRNTSVKHLNFAGIAFNDANLKALQELVKTRKDFTAIDLSHTGISPSIQLQILEQLPTVDPKPIISALEKELQQLPEAVVKQHPCVVSLEQQLTELQQQVHALQQLIPRLTLLESAQQQTQNNTAQYLAKHEQQALLQQQQLEGFKFQLATLQQVQDNILQDLPEFTEQLTELSINQEKIEHRYEQLQQNLQELQLLQMQQPFKPLVEQIAEATCYDKQWRDSLLATEQNVSGLYLIHWSAQLTAELTEKECAELSKKKVILSPQALEQQLKEIGPYSDKNYCKRLQKAVTQLLADYEHLPLATQREMHRLLGQNLLDLLRADQHEDLTQAFNLALEEHKQQLIEDYFNNTLSDEIQVSRLDKKLVELIAKLKQEPHTASLYANYLQEENVKQCLQPKNDKTFKLFINKLKQKLELYNTDLTDTQHGIAFANLLKEPSASIAHLLQQQIQQYWLKLLAQAKQNKNPLSAALKNGHKNQRQNCEIAQITQQRFFTTRGKTTDTDNSNQNMAKELIYARSI